MALSFVFAVLSLGVAAFGQPIELDDSFLTTRADTPWLVEFYAPWCGHCRKLEPIYHQVFLTLREQGSPIKVAKIDATRFSSVASEFSVRGFPTIKYIQGTTSYTHRGERSRQSIIEFAKRALGPRVRTIPNQGKFNDVKGEHTDGVFFMYVGDQDPMGDLTSKYKSVADTYAVLSYFYSGERRALPESMKLHHDPTVVVFKDGTYYEYSQPSDGITKKSLEDFVNTERFTIFPKASGGMLNEMSEMNKKLVIIVTDEKEKRSKPRQERLKEMSRLLIVEKREELHSNFQFSWMGEKETADSITMTTMENPSVFVLDPVTQFYYFPPVPLEEMTRDDFHDFLLDIQAEKIQAHGGTGFLQRIKRLFYDIFTTLYSLYEHSGWLALLVLGVPVLVISIVCYALCCMEPFDDSIFERQEGEGEGDGDEDGHSLTEDGEDAAREECEGDPFIEKSDDLKKSE